VRQWGRSNSARLSSGAGKKGMESGTTPLDHLFGIMRDEGQDARSRLDAAKAAAPYCHARLSSTELSGPSGGPVSVQTSQKLDISDLNHEELDILERALVSDGRAPPTGPSACCDQ
jgi:hypothetical protein